MVEPTITTAAPSAIAEVKAFLKAKEALDELRALFPVAFAKLVELAGPYNATLEAAAEAVRVKQVKCGPFDLYSFTKRFDPDALYDAVGRQKFASMGGHLEPTETRTVDKARFLALAAQGTVGPALAAKVLRYTPNFHAPPAIDVKAFR